MPIERLSLVLPDPFGVPTDLFEGLTVDALHGHHSDLYMWSSTASASSSSASSPRSTGFGDVHSPPSFLVSGDRSSSSSSDSSQHDYVDSSPSICPSLLFEAPATFTTAAGTMGDRPVGSAIPEGTWSANKTMPVVRPKPRRPSEAARASEMAREVAALRQLMNARQASPTRSPTQSAFKQQQLAPVVGRKRKSQEMLGRRVSFAAADPAAAPVAPAPRPVRSVSDQPWVDLIRLAEAKAGTVNGAGAALYHPVNDVFFARQAISGPTPSQV